jgi:glutamate-1-semialdehyde 2,1-aminomutase
MAIAKNTLHQEMLTKANRYFPGGSNGNMALPAEYAFVIASGQGSRVSDLEGNTWIDYLLGSGPMILGHAHPAVISAVQEQLSKGTTFFYL